MLPNPHKKHRVGIHRNRIDPSATFNITQVAAEKKKSTCMRWGFTCCAWDLPEQSEHVLTRMSILGPGLGWVHAKPQMDSPEPDLGPRANPDPTQPDKTTVASKATVPYAVICWCWSPFGIVFCRIQSPTQRKNLWIKISNLH